MARKRASRATGVGRGNGPGSAGTQYRNGYPSGNPSGRPAKKVEPLNLDIRVGLRAALKQKVPVTENGKTTEMSEIDAMCKLLIADFRTASVRDKLMIFKLLTIDLAGTLEEPEKEVDGAALQDLVSWIAQEAKLEKVYDRNGNMSYEIGPDTPEHLKPDACRRPDYRPSSSC